MVKGRICVIGFPSVLGGADTELYHQMEIWNALGIEVHLIHHSGYSDSAKQVFSEMRTKGFIIHPEKAYHEIDNMPCISYCAGPALRDLHIIRKYTETFIFVNCMTWLFPKEKETTKTGLITHQLYQRQAVMDSLFPQLVQLNGGVHGAVVKPYFDASKFKFNAERNFNEFMFGRIGREDAGKYHKDTIPIAHSMVSPKMKSGIFLGINDAIKKKIGTIPDWIETYPACGITQEEFYSKVNVIVQPCDPNHTENLPRITFEAMATGVIPIVDRKGGFPDQVIDGVTGWLCSDYKEYVYKCSRAAYDVKEREQMAISGRDHLNDNWGFEACKEGWKSYFENVGVL